MQGQGQRLTTLAVPGKCAPPGREDADTTTSATGRQHSFDERGAAVKQVGRNAADGSRPRDGTKDIFASA